MDKIKSEFERVRIDMKSNLPCHNKKALEWSSEKMSYGQVRQTSGRADVEKVALLQERKVEQIILFFSETFFYHGPQLFVLPKGWSSVMWRLEQEWDKSLDPIQMSLCLGPLFHVWFSCSSLKFKLQILNLWRKFKSYRTGFKKLSCIFSSSLIIQISFFTSWFCHFDVLPPLHLDIPSILKYFRYSGIYGITGWQKN